MRLGLGLLARVSAKLSLFPFKLLLTKQVLILCVCVHFVLYRQRAPFQPLQRLRQPRLHSFHCFTLG